MSKWICSHCNAINPSGAFKCHNCPNTAGSEEYNRGTESEFDRLFRILMQTQDRLKLAIDIIDSRCNCSSCFEHDQLKRTPGL